MIARSEALAALSSDENLPDAGALLGDAGDSLVGEFLARRHWEMHSATPVQIVYQPGTSCAVRYRVRAISPHGPRLLSLCAETRRRQKTPVDPPEDFAGRFGLDDPVEQRGPHLVWAFPYDPQLTDLPDSAWGPSVKRVLSEQGDEPVAVHVRPLRYRPRRRAVFRYVRVYGSKGKTPTRTAFGKVLRSSRAGQARDVAGFLDVGPARRWPRRRRGPSVHLSLPFGNLGHDGLLFEAVPGKPLASLLALGETLPDPQRLVSLLEDFSLADDRLLGVPARRHQNVDDAACRTATLLARIAPDTAPQASAVVEAIAAGMNDGVVRTSIVHGDLYEAQIYVRDDFSLGLIDLDDAGAGDIALDAANFTAHLLAFAFHAPALKDRLVAYRKVLRSALLERFDIAPKAFAWREALVMLQLSTGPFRTLRANWPKEVRGMVEVSNRLLLQQSI